ncbi:MAG: sulfatase-like hydrolase/transferase, partial [Deltaproteobacteria bacterium]|nr:sulfatase-like hydrolase/transferase [Deltaproteobacteria bacterium]
LMNAAVRALEVVDECVGRVVAWIERSGALGILTADHGNCEKMMGDDGEPLTSHTLFPVPFIVIDPLRKPEVKAGGRLCDIAPTILALWGVPQPAEMTGNSLIGSR